MLCWGRQQGEEGPPSATNWEVWQVLMATFQEVEERERLAGSAMRKTPSGLAAKGTALRAKSRSRQDQVDHDGGDPTWKGKSSKDRYGKQERLLQDIFAVISKTINFGSLCKEKRESFVRIYVLCFETLQLAVKGKHLDNSEKKVAQTMHMCD